MKIKTRKVARRRRARAGQRRCAPARAHRTRARDHHGPGRDRPLHLSRTKPSMRHLGYTAQELLGRNALDFLHPDDAPAMRERFRNILAAPDDAAGTQSLRISLSSSRWQLVLARERRGQRARESRRARDHRALARHQSPQGQRTHPVAEPRALPHRRGPVRRRGARVPDERRRACTNSSGPWAPSACTAAAKRSTGAAAGRAFTIGDGWQAESAARMQRYLAGRDRRVHRADPPDGWRTCAGSRSRIGRSRIRPPASSRDWSASRWTSPNASMAADALRESEFRYRTVAELTSGFVYEATVDRARRGRSRLGQPGLGKILRRLVRGSSTGSAGGTFFLPRTTPARFERRQRLRSGERTEMDMALKTLSGATRWVHLANQPIVAARRQRVRASSASCTTSPIARPTKRCCAARRSRSRSCTRASCCPTAAASSA